MDIREKERACRTAALAAAVVAVVGCLFARPSPRLVPESEDATPVAPEVLPLSEDELAGLAWLEYVTGPLSGKQRGQTWLPQ